MIVKQLPTHFHVFCAVLFVVAALSWALTGAIHSNPEIPAAYRYQQFAKAPKRRGLHPPNGLRRRADERGQLDGDERHVLPDSATCLVDLPTNQRGVCGVQKGSTRLPHWSG